VAGRRNDLIALAILAMVPTVLFLDVLLGWGVLYQRDTFLYFYPVKKIFRDIVLSGEFPYWNPMTSAGQPLAANPAYEVFYPLNWLMLLPSAVYGYNLLAVIHIHLAAFATYAFLRTMSVSRTSAVAGGLAFALGGVAVSSLHLLPVLFSAAWMPLTCLFTRRYLRDRSRRDFAFAAVSLGMQVVIGEPVTVLQTGLLLGLYALFRNRGRNWRAAATDVLIVGAISIAALFVSAAQSLPLLDHYSDSIRAGGFTYAGVADWSTPPIRFAEFLYPDMLGSDVADANRPYWGPYERKGAFYTSIYSGLLVAVLVIAGVAARSRGWLLFLAAAATSAVLALGDYTPVLRILFDAGVADSLRYPEKCLLLGVFASVVFAAIVLDRFLEGDAVVRRYTLLVTVVTTAVAGIALAATLASRPDGMFAAFWDILDPALAREAQRASVAAWVAAFVRGIALTGAIVLAARLRRPLASALLVAIVVADLTPAMLRVVPRMPPAFYTDPPPAAARLAPDRHTYRIFTIGEWTPKSVRRRPYARQQPHFFLIHRNALSGYSPAVWGIRGAIQVDYDLTLLRPAADFAFAVWEMQASTSDWLNYLAAMSNVRYLGVYQPLDAALRGAGGDARLIEPVRFVEGNPYPRYYFATGIERAADRREFVRKIASGRFDRQTAFVGETPFTPARGLVLRWAETSSSARIEVEAEGVSFLVMSVTPHKYWRITIDGREVPAVVTNIGYQGIVVPAGRHLVEMRYRNPLVAAGGAVSIATILLLAFAGWRAPAAATMRGL
jgi:hypothetical protein